MNRRSLARPLVLALTLLALCPSAVLARDAVYVGSTQSGQTVRFVVGGARVGDMTFGSLPTACAHFDAFVNGFVRLRPTGRFHAFFEVPSGSEFVTVNGRLRSGTASGTVGTTSPDDCRVTSERWSARRLRIPLVAGQLDGGPALAGVQPVWGERRGHRLLVRERQASGRDSILFRTRTGAGRAGLSASALAIGLSLGKSQWFGPLAGPLTRIAGCRQPRPAVDGPLVLYQTSDPCGSKSELRLRDLSSGSDTLVERLAAPATALRLAGRFAAIAHVGRIDVVDRSTGTTVISAPRPRLRDFDIQSDGKLALSRPVKKPLCRTCLRIEWYSPAEPRPHIADVPWRVVPRGLWIEQDRIAYVARERSVTSIRVSGLADSGFTLATLSHGRLVGDVAFDGTHTAFAWRPARGATRIEVLPN
jgi:hypothetical protein